MKSLNGFKALFLFMAIALTMTSCEVAGDIFKAGLWIGIIVVVAIIAVVLWIFRKLKR